MAVNKTSYVVDSSFILAFLLNEDNILVNQYIKRYINNQIKFVSIKLLKYEVANGLRSAFLRKRINQKQALKLYQAFLNFNIQEFKVNYINVLKLAIMRKQSVYDAAYVFLANIKKLPLLTLDMKIN